MTRAYFLSKFLFENVDDLAACEVEICRTIHRTVQMFRNVDMKKENSIKDKSIMKCG